MDAQIKSRRRLCLYCGSSQVTSRVLFVAASGSKCTPGYRERRTSMALKIDPRKFPDPVEDLPVGGDAATLVLAGGCFWCTEAVFRLLEGVSAVRPGYAGGSADTADYTPVSTGGTGHAEAIEIRVHTSQVNYGQLPTGLVSVPDQPNP